MILKNEKQHYASKFYLKKFTTENALGKDISNVYIKNAKKCLLQNIKDVAIIHNFYNTDFPIEDFTPQMRESFSKLPHNHLFIQEYNKKKVFSLEKWFASKYEKKLSIKLNRIDESNKMTSHQKEFMALMCAFFLVRGPRWENDFKIFYEETRRKKDYYCFKTNNYNSVVSSDKEIKFLWLCEIVLLIEKLKILLIDNYNIWLYHNYSDMKFITSDNPVIKLNDDEIACTPFCNFLNGSIKESITLLFPLSPNNLLVFEYKKNNKRCAIFDKINDQFVKAVNRYVLSNSINYLFSTTKINMTSNNELIFD